MSKQKIAILFGGKSSEHEVSRVSATMVIDSIPRDKYEPVLVGITKSGKWYLFEGRADLIKDGEWEHSGKITPAVISPDAETHGLIVFRESGDEIIRIDAAFPMLHGKNGEDGTMQGLFELAGIPYVGCDTASSAICMDKALTNTILAQGGVPQAKFVWFYRHNWQKDSDKYINRVEKELGYPCFVKPANAGSSVGISKAKDREGLRGAVTIAACHDPKIVIEEGIDGAEVEVAVMGNGDEIIVSVPGEIVPGAEWYDYDAKYNNSDSVCRIPAPIDSETLEVVRETAAKAYKLLGCSGLARVDFFVRDGEVLLNEPNTLPGFTPISMYPKMMEHSGISNSELVDKLIQLAIERANGVSEFEFPADWRV